MLLILQNYRVMNPLRKNLSVFFRNQKFLRVNFCSQISSNDSISSEKLKVPDTQDLVVSSDLSSTPILHRDLHFLPKHLKPREVWVENFDTVKEKKRGLVELHPKIFGTIPRLDLIFTNMKWQNHYKTVVLYSAKTRAEMKGGGRKPHPQKGLGKARQGSIRAPHLKGGGTCHGPRNPTSYFFMLPFHMRVHGLTSTLSAKFAQDDIHVVDNINIPTDDSQFILDLIKERKWGSSVLIVDESDIMPRNITIATDSIDHVNLVPAYGLDVISMLKHDTLVLTLAAVNVIESRLITLLNAANDFDLKKFFSQ